MAGDGSLSRDEQIAKRTGILNAVLIPDAEVRQQLPTPVAPVNTFRFLFKEYLCAPDRTVAGSGVLLGKADHKRHRKPGIAHRGGERSLDGPRLRADWRREASWHVWFLRGQMGTDAVGQSAEGLQIPRGSFIGAHKTPPHYFAILWGIVSSRFCARRARAAVVASASNESLAALANGYDQFSKNKCTMARSSVAHRRLDFRNDFWPPCWGGGRPRKAAEQRATSGVMRPALVRTI